jgi:hypothetical protein
LNQEINSTGVVVQSIAVRLHVEDVIVDAAPVTSYRWRRYPVRLAPSRTTDMPDERKIVLILLP